jgi:hypothetical protein
MLGTSAALSTAAPTRNARYGRRRQIGAQHEREDAIMGDVRALGFDVERVEIEPEAITQLG